MKTSKLKSRRFQKLNVRCEPLENATHLRDSTATTREPGVRMPLDKVDPINIVDLTSNQANSIVATLKVQIQKFKIKS